jgi:hypothetical protein
VPLASETSRNARALLVVEQRVAQRVVAERALHRRAEAAPEARRAVSRLPASE